MRRVLLLLLVPLLILSWFLIGDPLFFIGPVQASTDWEDSLTFYGNITIVNEHLRNVTNGASYPVRVDVEYQSGQDINRLHLYELTTSDDATIFVKIENGVVTKSSDTYDSLGLGQTLYFDVRAKPIDTIQVGQNATVIVKVTTTELPGGGGWRRVVATDRFEVTLITQPYIGLSLGQFLTNNMRIEYTVTILNKHSKSLTLNLRAWVTDLDDALTVLALSNTSYKIPPTTRHNVNCNFSMPISDNIFTAWSHLTEIYVLHIVAEDPQAQVETEALIATIQVDGRKTIAQLGIIGGLLCGTGIVLYPGFRKKKREEPIE